jgi:hypothetical protein
MKHKSELYKNYEIACNAYLKAFCEKHGYCFDSYCYWVEDDAGTVAIISDYWVDMQTIITDIECNAKEDEFLKWCDYCIELRTYGIGHIPNYKDWLNGLSKKNGCRNGRN